MKWRKLGHIFTPSNEYDWMRSHAAQPFAVKRGGNIVRIYFSTRDEANRSSIGWVEIDITLPQNILGISSRPALTPGSIGCFDDSGASIGCIIRRDDKLWLYYMGWNLGVTVPWRNTIGLAISEDQGDTFERVSLAPIMDRSRVDLYTLSYPWVIEENGALRMWYGSSLAWGAQEADMYHMIKSAHSTDGIEWVRDGNVVLTSDDEAEYAFARPSVLRDMDM